MTAFAVCFLPLGIVCVWYIDEVCGSDPCDSLQYYVSLCVHLDETKCMPRCAMRLRVLPSCPRLQRWHAGSQPRHTPSLALSAPWSHSRELDKHAAQKLLSSVPAKA